MGVMVSEQPKIEPASASADARRNAYYYPCDIVGQRRSFAVCIAKVEKRVCNDEVCSGAIKRKQCPAIAMREEEVLKGKAIYFTQRNIVEAFINKLKTFVSGSTEEAPAPKKRESGMLGEISSVPDYSDALTSIAKRESVASKTTPVSFTKFGVRSGETPLEAARRKAAQMKGIV